jgi:hypothetical protein
MSEWANGSVSGQGGGLNMGRRVKERCFRVSEWSDGSVLAQEAFYFLFFLLFLFLNQFLLNY